MTDTRIESLKARVEAEIRQGDYEAAGLTLQELDSIWADDRAAKVFYTYLEGLNAPESN